MARWLVLLVVVIFAHLSPDASGMERKAEGDALFAALAAATSEADGQRIENEIWQYWMQGPDDEATARMQEIMTLRREERLDEALTGAEALIVDYPEFAEAWNQKATLLFLMQRHDESLDAIIRVLELEPRHFGALSGRAIIFIGQGRVQLGKIALRQALAINPWLRERSLIGEDQGQPL